MAVSLVATAGAANANSYADVATADAYLGACADSHAAAAAWRALSSTGADADTKARALIEATRRLDLLTYTGDLAAPLTQRLQWPRAWVRDPRRGSIDPRLEPGVPLAGDLTAYLATDSVPRWIADATCELAAELVAADAFGQDPQGNVKRKSIAGAIETEYFEPGRVARGLAQYPRVWQNLAPFLVSGARVVRG
jgi:hypothetical protein